MSRLQRGDRGPIKFISKNSPEYKLEFINGAICNITPRGELVCDFHFESKDRPVEQEAKLLEAGIAQFSDFKEQISFTRDVKFGIILTVPFAKDLVKLLNLKIDEFESRNKPTEHGDADVSSTSA
jgi:hypothetical protein